MKEGTRPDPDKLFPVTGTNTVTHVKPAIRNPNIIVGDLLISAIMKSMV